MRKSVLFLVFVVCGWAAAQDAAKPEKKAAAPAGSVTAKWIEPLQWRPIGPANMGGRITAIAVYEKDPSTWWAATASGGLVKTVNNGVSFEHQFDKEKTVSIGDVAVAQSDPNIVWVGTGEANPRNSVSWGDGVYKSTDGGATWKRMGLEKSFQIGQVRIHPSNPDIVYVAALGRLWGPNEQRGLFKTTDGGKTWSKILYVDEKTGVIDVQLHPKDANTLLVATWERKRDGFDTNDPSKRWGPGSGLHKSTDGGKTFKKITAGLPSGQLGRLGIEYYRGNPDIVYLVLESERIGKEPENAPFLGITGADADAGARLTSIVKDGPAEKAGLKQGDIVLAINDQTVHGYNDFIRLARQHVAGDKIKIEISRQRKGELIELTLGTRPKPPTPPEGQAPPRGRQRRSPFAGGLGGQRANFQDQQGKEGHEYGGVFRSTDGGETWARINSINPRPMYFSEIRIDPSDPRHVWVLGIRLWRSEDGAKEMKSDGGRGAHPDHHALWIDPRDGRHMILGTDGGIYVTWDRGKKWDHLNHVAIGQFYHVGVGPRRAYNVYGGLQDNGSWGGPSRVRHGRGPTNADWVRIGGGDGFVCRVDRNDPDLVYFEMQNGGIGRRHLKTAERAGLRPRGPRGTRYRFNWNTPFILSHHNSKIYYTAGNKVFRSLDRGNGLRAISPEIAHTDRGSATALAESPRDPDVLYVGTDDGALWITRDGGHNWTDLYGPPKEEKPKEAPPPAIVKAGTNGNGEEEKEAPAPQDDAKPKDDAPKPAPAPEGRAARILERLMQRDTNGDGALQKDELPERMQEMFERIDANKDGVLDEAEIKAMAARRGRRGQGREAAPAKPAVPGKSIADLVPERRWVNYLQASRFEPGRAYVVFDGHRSDDDRQHIYATEDFGATWRSLRGNLPDDAGTTRVLQEDLTNADLLYLGTEFGAWVSTDRGETWTSLNSNLPTVAVHAFAQHAAAGEIVAGTHGRSLWVLDVNPLRQLKEAEAADVYLFKPKSVVQWRPRPSHGGSRAFIGANPSSGAAIYYTLKKPAQSVTLKIEDANGKTVRDLTAKPEQGLHRVDWDLRRPRPQGRRGRWFRAGPRVGPGTYRIVLSVDDQTYTRDLPVEIDPEHTDKRWIGHENHAEAMEAERLENRSRRKFPWRHEESGND